ncbi:MAG: GntR family transcriptional regulator [Eubacteriales bacterium]|nr:GntR family transcriptional regulator [Eubacteriales bacterium]
MPTQIPSLHGSLRHRVYNQLRDRILSGTYARGTALTEIRVSQDLGVSRTPIREAFSQLLLDGLVRATPNKGIIVEGLDQNDLLDWYDLRIRMEGMAAEKATQNLTPELVADLEETIAQASQMIAGGQLEALLQQDAHFHDVIFRTSGSKVLQNFLNPIAHYTRQSRQISLANPERARAVLAEHSSILEAMKAGDSQKARAYMEQHIGNAAQSYRNMIENRTGGPHAH